MGSRSVRELTQGNKMQKRRYEGGLRERVMSRKERRQEEGKRVFRKPERQDIRREVDDERNHVKRSTISKERRLRTDNVLTDSRNEEKIISTRRGIQRKETIRRENADARKVKTKRNEIDDKRRTERDYQAEANQNRGDYSVFER